MYAEYRVILLWSFYIMLDDILKNDLKYIQPRCERIIDNSFYKPFLLLTYHVLFLERTLFPTLYKIVAK